MKMRLATKLGGGYIILALLMLVSGGAGIYGVNKLNNLLEFISGPALDSLQGISSSTQTLQTQLREVEAVISGSQHTLHTDDEDKAYAEGEREKLIQDELGKQDASIVRGLSSLQTSGLLPQAGLGAFVDEQNKYFKSRNQLLDTYLTFNAADTTLRENFYQLQLMLIAVEDIGDAAVDVYANRPTKMLSWNTGLKTLWDGADGAMMVQIALLERIYHYTRFIDDPFNKSIIADLETSMNEVANEYPKIEPLRIYKKKVPKRLNAELAGMTHAKALAKLIARHVSDFDKAMKLKQELYNANLNYEQVVGGFLLELDKQQQGVQAVIDGQDENIATTIKVAYIIIGTLLLFSLVFAATLGVYLTRLIREAFNSVVDVCQRIHRGDMSTIEVADEGDEIGEMFLAMKSMVDTLEGENVRLNDSVVDLLEATSELSQKDLTVKVPVSEDVTGPIADAMNMMAMETAQVLLTIRTISESVETVSLAVKSQGDKVSDMAAHEREVIEQTIGHLEEASTTMNTIAKLAQVCNQTASLATQSTETALQTVTNTVNGMGEIRATITETEKRIKRLGERSQEIQGIVDIINNIAERTHVLALNASMQAAAAGDAGRGFAVVADEVQRLAESSRDSTSQIATLVNNIQGETAETMATMNRTISQVVDGSELAEQAGRQMQETRRTTGELVTAVGQIAESSQRQATASLELRTRAEEIQEGTQKTRVELQTQSDQTTKLVQFSARLLESVNVFKLPEK